MRVSNPRILNIHQSLGSSLIKINSSATNAKVDARSAFIHAPMLERLSSIRFALVLFFKGFVMFYDLGICLGEHACQRFKQSARIVVIQQ